MLRIVACFGREDTGEWLRARPMPETFQDAALAWWADPRADGWWRHAAVQDLAEEQLHETAERERRRVSVAVGPRRSPPRKRPTFGDERPGSVEAALSKLKRNYAQSATAVREEDIPPSQRAGAVASHFLFSAPQPTETQRLQLVCPLLLE